MIFLSFGGVREDSLTASATGHGVQGMALIKKLAALDDWVQIYAIARRDPPHRLEEDHAHQPRPQQQAGDPGEAQGRQRQVCYQCLSPGLWR